MKGPVFTGGFRPFFWTAFLAVAVYAATLTFGLTYFDDNIFILDNGHFLSDISNLPSAFTTNVFMGTSDAVYYRPLMNVSFFIDTFAGKGSLAAYHASNLLFHVICSLLVLGLLRRFGSKDPQALFLAGIFAVHPALSMAVSWIPGRNDSLLCLFVLASMLFFMRYLEGKKPSDAAVSAAALFLAMLAKESAAMLFPVAVLYVWMFKKGRNIFLFALWSAAVGAWAGLKAFSSTGGIGIEQLPGFISGTFIPNLPAVLVHIGKAVIPLGLSPVPVLADSSLLPGLAAIFILAVLFFSSRTADKRTAVLAVVWTLAFLLPGFTSREILEYRMYLPFFGLLLLAGELGIVKDRDLSRPAAGALCAAVILLLFFLNLSYTKVFSGGYIFWRTAAASSPSYAKTHLNLGTMYYFEGMPSQAKQLYLKALSVDPDTRTARHALGVVLMGEGRTQEAIAELNRELEINPDYARTYSALGAAYYSSGDIAQAETSLLKARELAPYLKKTNYYLALCALSRKSRPEAAAYLREELAIDPLNAAAASLLGDLTRD